MQWYLVPWGGLVCSMACYCAALCRSGVLVFSSTRYNVAAVTYFVMQQCWDAMQQCLELWCSSAVSYDAAVPWAVMQQCLEMPWGSEWSRVSWWCLFAQQWYSPDWSGRTGTTVHTLLAVLSITMARRTKFSSRSTGRRQQTLPGFPHTLFRARGNGDEDLRITADHGQLLQDMLLYSCSHNTQWLLSIY